MTKDKLIGIDLGGTTIKMAILTDKGEIQDKWAIKTNILDDGKHIVPDIIHAIDKRLDLYKLDRSRVIGIGMGTPGTVDRENGTVEGAFNLNWKVGHKQHVREQIEKELGFKVNIDNDANVAALGEAWKGAGENNPEVSFITLGTGVGGGLVANGKLIHGIAGAGGEVGHMVVERENGYECTCGNYGCLERYASATGVVHLAEDLAAEYEGSSALKKMVDDGEEVTSKIVFDLAKEGDFLANQVVDRVAYYLGYAASIITNVLNPSALVIGGGVAAAGEFLRVRVEENWTKWAFPTVRKSTVIKMAQLGNDAGVIGAASLARDFIEE